MFYPIQSLSEISPLLKVQAPTENNIALDFPVYLAFNEIDFQNQKIEDQEFTLHDYVTHELGLNVFTDIKDQNTITLTYGFQERNEYLDIDLRKSIPKQIEKLLHEFNQFACDLAA